MDGQTASKKAIVVLAKVRWGLKVQKFVSLARKGRRSAFWSDRRGITALEYALMAGAIFLAIVAGTTQLGQALNNRFLNIESSVAAVDP